MVLLQCRLDKKRLASDKALAKLLRGSVLMGMASDVVALPREPDTLIEMIVELRDENGKLRAMLDRLRRTLFGARSERAGTDPGQLALELDDVSKTPVEPEPEVATPPPQEGRTRRKSVRNIGSLPKHLPREDVFIEPETETCPCCRGALHRIDEDVSEMLDIVPAIIRVKRIHRPRYGCRACESAVVQAPAPPRPVDGGLPTTALLAHIAAAKFAWHLPLHRQTQILAGYGIELDRSTLVHWIGWTAWWLQPLYTLLSETVMAAGKVFCDDTPLPVLDRTRRRTRIARLWCYAVDDRPWQGPVPPAVIYRYAEDRRGRHVKEHLDGFHGVLQVDGYAGYHGLARPNRPGGPITLAYCLAHTRREFFDVHKRTKDPIAAEALRRIGEIYAIEARLRGRPAAGRVAIRQAETKPLMTALWSWLMQRLEEISKKSSLASAIRYTLGHWEGLSVFSSDGRIEVDNNTVERAIRPIPLGRKNALVKTNAYSVPVRAGSRVEARAYPLHVELWHSGRRVARHERCHRRRQHVLDLEHYLDVLSHKPGAFAGSKPLAQWREAGRWPPCYDELWAQLLTRHGKQNGTRAMVRSWRWGGSSATTR